MKTRSASKDKPAPLPQEELTRRLEALLFLGDAPILLSELVEKTGAPAEDLEACLALLVQAYASRGFVLSESGAGWSFRTAPDLGAFLASFTPPPKALSPVALEVLSIIAYHQPLTRGAINAIRGVGTSQPVLESLLACGWIVPLGRKKTVGRPLLWGTTPAFLDHFGLQSLKDLPGVAELKQAGYLPSRELVLQMEAGDLSRLPRSFSGDAAETPAESPGDNPDDNPVDASDTL